MTSKQAVLVVVGAIVLGLVAGFVYVKRTGPRPPGASSIVEPAKHRGGFGASFSYNQVSARRERMPTLRAQVTFRVKEPGAEPAISVEQSSKGVDPENLFFDLKPGTSMKDAERIANYLNENIKGILQISVSDSS